MNGKTILTLFVTASVIAVAFAMPFLVANRTPSLVHLWRLGFVWSVAKYLLAFFGVWATHHFSKSFIEVSRVRDTWQSELKHYLIGIGFCGVIASGAGYELGTHREDADPVFGGGEIVVDYNPTDDQRIRHGLVFFFGLCIPALFGMHEALAELHYKRRKSTELPNERSA
jgi:hypothetical protein